MAGERSGPVFEDSTSVLDEIVVDAAERLRLDQLAPRLQKLAAKLRVPEVDEAEPALTFRPLPREHRD
jgi:hypothetical protein